MGSPKDEDRQILQILQRILTYLASVSFDLFHIVHTMLQVWKKILLGITLVQQLQMFRWLEQELFHEDCGLQALQTQPSFVDLGLG